MESDHCIITKYELSEREKQIKKAFFSKCGVKPESDSKEGQDNKREERNAQRLEMILKENFRNDKFNAYNYKYRNENFPEMQNAPSVPLNLIYSQNKILERNVDILQETQKSIHDLLVFNMKSHQGGQARPSEDNNLHTLKSLVTPLYKGMEDLKLTLADLSKEKSSKYLNEKVIELMSKQNEMKVTSLNAQRSLVKVEKNEKTKETKDNVILKAISDLKDSVCQITNEVSKIETEFNSNLKRIILQNEKKNLNYLISSVNDSVKQTDEKVSKKIRTHDVDYIKCRSELLDINLEKEEILNSFNAEKNKLKFDKLLIKPEKSNFTYSLDFDCVKSVKNVINPFPLDSAMSPIQNRSEVFNEKTNNVFLNHMGVGAHNASSLMLSSNKERNVQSSKGKEESAGRMAYNNTKNRSEIVLNSPIRVESGEQTQSSIKTETNILHKMNEVKEKMKNYKINENKTKISQNLHNLNNEENSTKSSINKSNEPTSAKYHKTTKLNVKEIHPKTPAKEVKSVKLKLQEEIVNLIPSKENVTVVDKCDNESKIKHIIDELCLDKIKELKKEKQSFNTNVRSSLLIKGNEADNTNITSIVQSLMEEYIRTLNLKNSNSGEISDLIKNLTERFNEIEKALIKSNTPQEVDEMIHKITEKIKSTMQINITLKTPESNKNTNNLLSVMHNSLHLEGIKKEDEGNSQMAKSQYSHPFVSKEEVRDIPMPNEINFEEYSISSSSYFTQSRVSGVTKKKRNESLSVGQVESISDLTESVKMYDNYSEKVQKSEDSHSNSSYSKREESPTKNYILSSDPPTLRFKSNTSEPFKFYKPKYFIESNTNYNQTDKISNIQLSHLDYAEDSSGAFVRSEVDLERLRTRQILLNEKFNRLSAESFKEYETITEQSYNEEGIKENKKVYHTDESSLYSEVN